MISCQRDPILYLHEDGKDATMDLPNIDVELQAIWNYQLEYDVTYDWKAEWKYKWDATDVELFGKLGYTEPDAFNLGMRLLVIHFLSCCSMSFFPTTNGMIGRES
jgi:hypothetical protein